MDLFLEGKMAGENHQRKPLAQGEAEVCQTSTDYIPRLFCQRGPGRKSIDLVFTYSVSFKNNTKEDDLNYLQFLILEMDRGEIKSLSCM